MSPWRPYCCLVSISALGSKCQLSSLSRHQVPPVKESFFQAFFRAGNSILRYVPMNVETSSCLVLRDVSILSCHFYPLDTYISWRPCHLYSHHQQVVVHRGFYSHSERWLNNQLSRKITIKKREKERERDNEGAAQEREEEPTGS